MADRKLAWYELGRGALAKEMQAHFESAQIISATRGVKTEVHLKLTVLPPAKPGEPFGQISYAHQLKEPARESIQFQTELGDDGIATQDADTVLDLLQTDLLLPAKGQPAPAQNGGAA